MKVEEHIEVSVPVRTAYNQWTQFASFPEFMDGVKRVDQIDDTTTHWVTDIGGVEREFDAVITEQRPDERIAWTSVSGPRQAGTVSFRPIGGERTDVTLEMEYEPETLTEKLGDKLGFVKLKVRRDLERFAHFIEGRGRESGAWRGEV